MKEIIFLNGKFVTADKARISVLEPGFLHGCGVFETMRAYHKKIVYFSAHLERIESSSVFIGLRLPYTIEKIAGIIREAIKKSNLQDAYVRLTLWKEDVRTGISVIVRENQPYSAQTYKNGIEVTVSSLRQNEDSYFTRIKTSNRLLYEISYLRALKEGFAGSIILNNRGYITEATRSNIFFAKEENLFTPDLSCGCLPGITRQVIFDLANKYSIKVYEGNFTIGDLCAAEEVFFTNSLAGVMPVVSIDHQIIGKGICGITTKFFIEKYRCLLKSKNLF